MAIPLIMPKQGQSVETCIITKWYKLKGEQVKTGDILFSYETDKASFDIESPADGALLEIFYSDGAEVPVLATVALLGEPGEPAGSVLQMKQPEKEVTGITGSESEVPQIIPLKAEISKNSDPFRIRISPRAKRFAKEKDLNYSDLSGSGPNGRIICSDIEKLISVTSQKSNIAPESSDEFIEKPLSNVRRIVARAMYTSLRNSAQLTHHMSADARNILEARRKIKDGLLKGTEKQDITLNDIICFCVIKALLKFPEANSHYFDDFIRTFKRVHLGIAVDTPRGLMVPAVKNADSKELMNLSQALKSASESSKKGNINPELIQSTSATFTVSNLGNYGVEMFTPVINLPQVAILGVCTIINRPADLGNNTFGFIPFIGLSLTYDHRAIDGGPATLFLKEIREQIEKFSYIRS